MRNDYMDIKRWKVMLAVDDYGSFTRAGEELGIHSLALHR